MHGDTDRFVLRNARHLAAGYMLGSIRPGDSVVDATMGNGKDTLFLCGLVGEAGHVYAFDVQPEAVERTRERVRDAGMEARTTLILAGHETMRRHVPQGVRAVMFNLGWLPGAQHAVTTKTDTTLAAVEAALELICPGGVVTVCIYPGHEEGTKELDALLAYAQGLSVRMYNVAHHRFLNAAKGTPELILIQKNE
ncbi:MAG: class I SAM-dependent methyltransferase [Clostridia bacterium]|nr:class I SAM-dependent methyltransferase [Clostridia bacterium]MBQ2948941.1 class I SAM-dependent methyltransferase [Clostridia bacterium]MBQ4608942.1 class I SAM-dependent methyltransferase [Clostridia bacterium]MBQ6858327.1 class I SAM-dependent methyltransferase [Clostridia bacterium]